MSEERRWLAAPLAGGKLRSVTLSPEEYEAALANDGVLQDGSGVLWPRPSADDALPGDGITLSTPTEEETP